MNYIERERLINTYKEMYDQRHGGPFDRGSADSYYRRSFLPHFFKGDTHQSQRVIEEEMSADEIAAYTAGYEYNERFGDFKDWG